MFESTTTLPLAAFAAWVLIVVLGRQHLVATDPWERLAHRVVAQSDHGDLVLLEDPAWREQVPSFAPLATVATPHWPDTAPAFRRVVVVTDTTGGPLEQSALARGTLLWVAEDPPLRAMLFQLHDAELQLASLEELLPSAAVELGADGAVPTPCGWTGVYHACPGAGVAVQAGWAPVNGQPRRCVRVSVPSSGQLAIDLRPNGRATHVTGWVTSLVTDAPTPNATVSIDAGAAATDVLVPPGRTVPFDWALPLTSASSPVLTIHTGRADAQLCLDLRLVERAIDGAP